MFLVRFEFFTEDGLSKVANNGDYYFKNSLLGHLFIVDGGAPVLKASHVCVSHSNYEGNFFFDDVKHLFNLDISSQNSFAFGMNNPYSVSLDPSVLSLISPSSSGGSSSGSASVDLTPIQSALTALSSKIDSFEKINFLDLDGNVGSFPNGSIVTVKGVVGEYKVVSSCLSWDTPETAEIMITYILENQDGKKISSPHLFLTKKA